VCASACQLARTMTNIGDLRERERFIT